MRKKRARSTSSERRTAGERQSCHTTIAASPIAALQHTGRRSRPLFCVYSKRETARSLLYPFNSILSYQKSTLDGSGQIFAGKKLAPFHLSFTWDGRNWTKFGRLNVQVWDLKKAGQLFDRHGSNFVRTHVNTQTVELFSQIARLKPVTYLCFCLVS